MSVPRIVSSKYKFYAGSRTNLIVIKPEKCKINEQTIFKAWAPKHPITHTESSYCFILHILFLHILLVLHILFSTFLYSITHFTLYFFFLPIYICSCVVLILYNLYSLHCPLSGPDLIYISLLIIPCIIYHVANKETLTFTVINAFCVNLKHISKGNQLDLSQKVVTCL